MVMNEGVNVRFKSVMANFITVVDLIVEPSIANEKNGYIEAYPSIR